MRTRPLGTLGVALLVAATLASAPVLARSSPAAASFPVALTQKQAVQVVLDYYKENNQANSTLSTALQNQDEEGISAEMDNANYKLLGLEGKTSIPAFAALRQNISVYLSDATKSPAEFLAVVKFPATTGANPVAAYTAYLAFRKDTEEAPWRLLYEPSVASTLSVPGVKVIGGHAAIDSRASLAPTKEIGAYWSTGVNQAVVSGPDTSELYSADQSAISSWASNGITLGMTYGTTTNPATSIGVKDGILEFGVISNTQTEVPVTEGDCFTAVTQTNTELNALLPPGTSYNQVTIKSLIQVLIFAQSGKHLKLRVLSYDDQLMSASGTGCPS